LTGSEFKKQLQDLTGGLFTVTVKQCTKPDAAFIMPAN